MRLSTLQGTGRHPAQRMIWAQCQQFKAEGPRPRVRPKEALGLPGLRAP